MELDSTVPEAPSSSTAADSLPAPADDPYLADLLRVADNNIAQLKADTQQFLLEKEGLEGKVATFRKQVRCNASFPR